MTDTAAATDAEIANGAADSTVAVRFRLGHAKSPELLGEALAKHIVGQPKAVDAVVRALTISAAGIRDPQRPIASLLFAGPTGVGKTELARRLAVEVAGSADRLCRIDMNSLAQEHYAASLTGAPPGYSGSQEGLTLFDRKLIEGNHSRPGIVLFDEVEKAHTTVLRTLLQILDNGVLTLAAGNTVIDFRNSILLLTSNLGSAEVAARRRELRAQGVARRLLSRLPGIHLDQQPDDLIADAVESFFDPELYNRFDEVIQFDPISRTSARSILDLELRRLQTTLAGQNVSWSPTTAVTEYLLDVGFDQTYGARHLKRALRLHLYAPIAQTLSTQEAGASVAITTDVVGDAVIARSR